MVLPRGDLMLLEFSLKIKKWKKNQEVTLEIYIAVHQLLLEVRTGHPLEVMETFVHCVISGVLQKLSLPPKHLSHATLGKHLLGQSLSTVYIR